jgi:hypothetical protein
MGRAAWIGRGYFHPTWIDGNEGGMLTTEDPTTVVNPSPRWRTHAAVTVSALTLGLAGCILLVSPTSYGTTCHFSGMGTTCGSCIASQCQTEVNACCVDPGCSGTLDALDQCASGDGGACSAIDSETASNDVNSAGLAACIVRSCSNLCETHSSTSKTSCSVPEFGGGHSCQCSLSDQSNDTVCSSAAFPDTLCCAPDGWPAPSLQCTCQQLSCGPTADGCDCFLSPGESCTHVCSATICCQNLDDCYCGSAACLAQEKQVPSCSLSVVGCPVGNKQVESCSIAVKGD